MIERLVGRLEEIDREGTRRAYGRIPAEHPDRCPCAGCKNFEKVRPALFPASFLALLEALGIDPLKEHDARYLVPLEGGMSLYAGTYGFAGKMAEPPREASGETTWRSDVFEPVAPGAFVSFAPWLDAPFPWKSGRTLRLEFLLVLPWVDAGEPPAPLDLTCLPGRTRTKNHG